jgi:hypothetical protein
MLRRVKDYTRLIFIKINVETHVRNQTFIQQMKVTDLTRTLKGFFRKGRKIAKISKTSP